MPLAGSSTCFCSTTRPETSSESCRVSGFPPVWATRAVAAIRSRPAATSRSKATPTIAALLGSRSPASTTRSSAPAGSRTSSSPSRPRFWQSLISTTSRRGCWLAASHSCASFKPGAKRVAAADTVAVCSAARTRSCSRVGGRRPRPGPRTGSGRPRPAAAARESLLRGLLRAREVVAVAHAVRAVEQRSPRRGLRPPAASACAAAPKNGRAKASASSAIARQRSANSSKWRSFWRRAPSGTGSGSGTSARGTAPPGAARGAVRWTRIGTASAASPARNSGASRIRSASSAIRISRSRRRDR